MFYNTSRKVAFLVPSLRGGGAERTMVTLVNEFAQFGLNVDLVAISATGVYRSEVSDKVNIVDLKSKSAIGAILPLISYLRSEEPTHMLCTVDHVNLVGLFCKFLSRKNIRVIIRLSTTIGKLDVRRQTAKLKVLRFLMPYLLMSYKCADQVIAVSEGVRNDLLRIVSLPDSKISVIYNPVGSKEFYSDSHKSVDRSLLPIGSKPLVMAAGRFTKIKNLPILIHAFHKVSLENDATLCIFGDGEDKLAIMSLCDSLGISKDVFFPGFILNPFPYMRMADVFVLSSDAEGLPNSLIQALLLNVPVVSTNCPSGPAEILENGRLGILVEPGNVELLAKAITQQLNRPIRKLTNQVANKYDSKAIALQYAKVLGVKLN